MAESKFKTLQKDVCAQVPELPPLKKLCPRCEPNPNYIEPDWTSIPGETYLNEKTCEYQVCVTLNEVGKSMVLGLVDDDPNDTMPPRLPEDPVERRRILRSYIHPAITIMLEDEGKLVADQIICAYHEGPTLASISPEDLLSLANSNNLASLYELLQADPLSDRCRNEKLLDLSEYEPQQPTDEPIDTTAKMVQILSLLPEIRNPLALELYAYVKEFTIDPFDSILKVLVAIPAHIFEAVPNKPTKDELEKAASKIVEEVELDVPSLFGQINRLRTSLFVYSKYQSYFEESQDGNLKLFLNDQKYRKEPDYYAKIYSVEVKNFYNSLKNFAKKNGWNIRSATPSVALQNAGKIKITFDNSDEENPYVISKIEVKKRGCPYVEINKKFAKFFETTIQNASGAEKTVQRFNSTTMGYIAKLKEIDLALRARESYPWLEFLIKFTWPIIKVDYGDLSEDKIKDDAGDCVAKNSLEFGLDMKNFILKQTLSIGEIFSYEYNRKGCSQLESFENEPEVVEFQKDFKNVGKEARQEKYEDLASLNKQGGEIDNPYGKPIVWENEQELLNIIEKHEIKISNLKKELKNTEDRISYLEKNPPPVVAFSSSSLANVAEYNKELNELKTKKVRLVERVEENEDNLKHLNKALRETRRSLDKELKKARRKAARQAARDARKNNHPYIKKARQLALEELQSQNSILTSIIDLESWSQDGMRGLKFNDIEKKVSIETITDRMTYCNVKSLVVQGIRCLMSGVTQEAALRKIIRVALEEMDLDVFGIFINNLPPESQTQLRQQFEQEFGDLPLPWEEGYDPGSMDNTNPFIKSLKLSNFERKKRIKQIKQDNQQYSGKIEDLEKQLKQKQDEETLLIKVMNKEPEEQEKIAPSAFTDDDEDMPEKTGLVLSGNYDFGKWIKKESDEKYFREWMSENHGGEKFRGNNGKEDTISREIPKSGMGNSYIRAAWTRYGESFANEYVSEYLDDIDIYDIDRQLSTTSSTPPPTPDDVNEAKEAIEKLSKEIQVEKDKIKKTEQELATLQEEEESRLASKWKNLTDEQKEEVKASARVKKDPYKAGTYGAALGNIQKLIVDAYIKNMMDTLQIDQLLSVLERFPGSELLPRVLNKTGCATQAMFNPPIDSFLSTFALDTCGDLGIGIGVPRIVSNPLPNFYDKHYLTKLKSKFIKKVEETWTDILTGVLIKILQSIDQAICKGLNSLAKATGASMGLDNAIADTFCPDGDQEDINNTKNKLFKAAGIVPNTNPNLMNGEQINEASYDCLFKTLNATTSRREIISLLVSPPEDMDQKLLRRIAELTNAKCPEFSFVFGTPDKVADKFMRVANFVPVELRKVFQEELSRVPDGPVFQSICLTQEQKDEWDQSRINLLTDNGLDQKLAEKMINDSNERVLNSLGDLSQIAEKGFDGLLGDALEKIIDPSVPYDEPCKINNNKDSIFRNEESEKEKNDTIQILFETVEKNFLTDLIKGRNGVLNNILRDKNNFRLSKHELRTSYPLLWPDYTDSEEKWQFRKDNSNTIVSSRMKFANGIFPETVGIRMRTALFEQEMNFNSSLVLAGEQKQIEMFFTDNTEDKEYEFNLIYSVSREQNPTKRIVLNETFYRKLNKKEAKALGIDPEELGNNMTILSGSTDISYRDFFDFSDYSIDYNDASEPYEYHVFKALLEDKIGSEINLVSLRSTGDSINEKILEFTRKAVLENPDGEIPIGFKFGYTEQVPIKFEDLLYVNPDADPDDKSTWVYNHLPSEKVLGKSATENPRVHFLDPVIHGGSYVAPKIYIEPATYNGWLGMMKTFIPEVEKCEDVDNGFLNITGIRKRVKEVENNTEFDERLSLAPDCNVEIPFDKQLSPATHGLMEGIVISTIKIYATEFIIKTLPTFSSVEFSNLNVDSAFEKMLVQEMKKGLMSQTTIWNIIQGYTYYLLFLEQAVQVAQRRMNEGLLDSTPEIEEAFGIINSVMENFKAIKINPKKIIDGTYDYSDILDIFKGAAIIGFGEYWEDEVAKIKELDFQQSAENIADAAILGAGTAAGTTAAITLGSGTALAATAGATIGAVYTAKNDPAISNLAKLGWRLALLTPFKIELSRKVYAIHNAASAAETIMGALVKSQIEELMDKFALNLRPRPHVVDITKYLLSKNGIMVGSTLRSGETAIEQQTIEGANGFSYGNVLDVVRDPTTENPLDNYSVYVSPEIFEYIDKLEKGFFYLERYVRVFEKRGVLTGEVEIFDENTIPTETDPEYTGQVYNIKEFQEILQNSSLEQDSLISDNFGNASIVTLAGSDSINGTTGIKFGVRIVYCPPVGTTFEIPENHIQERTFQFRQASLNVETNDGPRRYRIENSILAIPVAVFEQDVLDKKISEINLTDENFGEDLKCYIDNLVETKDFKTLFNGCFSPKTFVSIFGVYTYYGFFNSIGKEPDNPDETQADPEKLKEEWKYRVFRDTKKELRKIFNSIYRTDDDDPEEEANDKKERNANFLASLAPEAFLNLDLTSVKWWQSLRIVEVRPFDVDGNECPNPFQKVFMKEKK